MSSISKITGRRSLEVDVDTVTEISPETPCPCCTNPAFPFLWTSVGICLSIGYIVIATVFDKDFFKEGSFITCFILCLIIIIVNSIVFYIEILETLKTRLYYITDRMLFWAVIITIGLIFLSLILCLLLSIGVPHRNECDTMCKLINFWGFLLVFLPFLLTLMLCQSFLAMAILARKERSKHVNSRPKPPPPAYQPNIHVYKEIRVYFFFLSPVFQIQMSSDSNHSLLLFFQLDQITLNGLGEKDKF